MPDDPADCLSDLELFRNLDAASRVELRKQGSLQHGMPREILYREGDPPRSVWILTAGRVRTCKLQRSGRITTLEEFEAGELIGLAAVLRAPAHAETAEWLSAGSAWRFAAVTLAGWLSRDPGLAMALLAGVARRLRRAHDRLCSFSGEKVAVRIAQVLVERGCEQRIQITRQSLSEVAGTTVETTIRVLTRFQRSGWIESGKGWIRVRDICALRALAQGRDTAAASETDAQGRRRQ
jgi:CRP-like cAMP-binding protein